MGQFDYRKTTYIPTGFFERLRHVVIKSRDVLLYKDVGKPGDFHPHVGMYGDGFRFERCGLNSHLYRLRLKRPLSQEYGYFWFSCAPVMDETPRLGTGVAIPSLPGRNLPVMKRLVPPSAVVRRIDSRTCATPYFPCSSWAKIRVPEAKPLAEVTE